MIITSYHLMSMPSASCHVNFYRNNGVLSKAELVSYNTVMLTAEYDGSSIKLTVNHPVDCSVTTARHVNRFTTELTGTNLYHELKKVPTGGAYIVDDVAVCLSDMAFKYQEHGKRWY
jgi:hypothetical protein